MSKKLDGQWFVFPLAHSFDVHVQPLWGGWVPKIPEEAKHLCDSCGRDASEAMTDMHDDGIDYQCPCGHDWTEYYNVVPEDYDGE